MERLSESVLREQIVREVRGHRPGRGLRYSATVRERATRYATARREAGASLRTIGRELGIPWKTVADWCRPGSPSTSLSARAGVSLVPVQVVSRASLVAPRTVAVTSPAGFRVEGLSLAEAAAMLRALG